MKNQKESSNSGEEQSTRKFWNIGDYDIKDGTEDCDGAGGLGLV